MKMYMNGEWTSGSAQMDVRNPYTGEPTIFKAKPARNVVKVQPLKNLKEMV